MKKELTELVVNYDKYVSRVKNKGNLDNLEKKKRSFFQQGKDFIHSLNVPYTEQCYMEEEFNDKLESVDDKYFDFFK
jgi:hypothetical protein